MKVKIRKRLKHSETNYRKIIIRGYNEKGVEEPLKITFMYKTGIHSGLTKRILSESVF